MQIEFDVGVPSVRSDPLEPCLQLFSLPLQLPIQLVLLLGLLVPLPHSSEKQDIADRI